MSRFSDPRRVRYAPRSKRRIVRRARLGDLTTVLTDAAGLSGLPECVEYESADLQGLKRLFKKVGAVVKKVAPIAATVAAGLFLGPAAGAVVKGVSGSLSKPKIPGVPAPVEAPPPESPAWQTALMTVLDVVQSQRVIKAVESGEVAPPPVSLQGQSFNEWATSIANMLAQQELQRQLTANERATIAQEVSRVQYAAAAQPAPQVVYTPMPQVPVAIQQAQEASAITGQNQMTMMMLGGMALVALVALRR